MITVYKDFDQRTEDWFRIKWGKIGGTLSKGLFVDSDTLLLHLVGEHTEDFELDDSFENKAMLRGKELEPYALSELSKYVGIEFIDVAWIQNEIYNLIGISPDGITEDLTEAAEVKCFERKQHAEVCLTGNIPKDNIHQAIHYFTVNPNLEKLHWCSFRPESKVKRLFVKTLTLDTVISIGLKKKGKITEDRGHGEKEYVQTINDERPIREWVKMAHFAALDIEEDLAYSITRIEF